MMPSLMIDHLSINLRSGTDNLVSEISFAIKEGESLILLGQSGSGKTMTCSAVLNLLDPKKFEVSGSVFFGETDLLNSSEKQRRGIYGNQIVYIPQNPMTALDPSMRIGRQMDETLRLHSDKSRQQRYNYILRLLHDVGLDDPDRVYRAYPHMLSGGMLQRVIIAMAMKNKKILAIGLCGAICLSIAGVTYASALASDTPKVSTSETGNTSGADILYQDTDGGQISVDGKNWVDEADYEKNNAAPDVQWWTTDEYEAWMNEQKKEMESLIGTGDGWYDGQGVFHEFTQESVDAMMDSYKETLESIKKGVLYSKDDGDGDTYSMIPPTEDVVSSYSVDVTKDNGKTVHIGDYSTVEELDKAISDAVKNGQLTQEEADSVQK